MAKNINPRPYTLPLGRQVVPSENQLAFLIMRSIVTKGQPPNPMLQKAIDTHTANLTKEISEFKAKQAQQEITKELKQNLTI